jgi:hypothetical protein
LTGFNALNEELAAAALEEAVQYYKDEAQTNNCT